jgi:hypothetical protein
MFSRWIVTNITSARGTVHCRKTHSLRGSTRDLWTVPFLRDKLPAGRPQKQSRSLDACSTSVIYLSQKSSSNHSVIIKQYSRVLIFFEFKYYFNSILKGSDDGVLYLIKPRFLDFVHRLRL